MAKVLWRASFPWGALSLYEREPDGVRIFFARQHRSEAYVQVDEETLASLREALGASAERERLAEEFEKQAAIHLRHVEGGTSVGGEHPAWNQGAAAALHSAAALVRSGLFKEAKS